MRAFFTENLGLKLVSLLLASALWAFVQTQHASEVAYFVPLELSGLPPNLVITNDVPPTVSIRVAGPRAQQTLLTPRKLALSIDLSGIQPGMSAFEISREQLSLPTGLTLTQISPERVRIEVEPLATKEVPVEWTTRGEVATGYRLNLQLSSIAPDRVTVGVAESEAAGLERIETRPVDVEGLRGDLRERVFLDRSDRRIRSVRPETVVLSLVIEEVVIEKTLDGIPVEVQGLDGSIGVLVEPALVRATVRGPFAIVDGLGVENLSARIDVSGLATGESVVVPEVRVPDRVDVVLVDPESVRVVISATPALPEAPDATGAPAQTPP